MTQHGSCHCGRVAFEVQGPPDGVISCNCAICQRKGALMWFAPRDHLVLRTADENASTCQLNHHVIRHRFCPVCGIHPHGEGQAMAAINVRCLEGVDLDALEVTPYDGRAR